MTNVLPVEQIELATRLGAAIDAINAALAGVTDPGQLLIGAKCRGLMAGYDARWCAEEMQVEDVEYLLESDLWNPETGRKSRSFRVSGKVDARVVLEGRLLIMDHKTTSDDISTPDAPYWKQLVVEGQVSHYMLLEWLNGRKVDGAIWDVIHKLAIAPKNVIKAEVPRVLNSGEYFGRKMSPAALDQLRETGREDLEMYEARLAYDCAVERPQRYFQRRSVLRIDAEIHEYATELWEHGQEILHVQNTQRNVRNSGACMLYNTPCQFLGVCSGHDSLESDKWQRKACVHSELPIEGDGRDVLTNSRIRCFQTCRRKHYNDYELGVERSDDEERASLYFGTLLHKGLEAWFLAAKEAAE